MNTKDVRLPVELGMLDELTNEARERNPRLSRISYINYILSRRHDIKSLN